jgi:hypothetical protein
MKKANINDVFTRRAIWDVYKHKCFYTGEPLDYVDMEIDHIIPSYLKDSPEELLEILRECELKEDFKLDSLYNLVPTSKHENRQKSNKKLETSTILFYLDRVKGNVQAIEDTIVKLKGRRDFEKDLTMLKSHVDEQEDNKKKRKLLEDIVGFIGDDSAEFDVSVKSNDT